MKSSGSNIIKKRGPATGAETAQYLQQSEQQSHMFRVLNELVCELDSQVICLLLGVLICEGD